MDFLCEIVQALLALAALGLIVVSSYNTELLLFKQRYVVACFSKCCICNVKQKLSKYISRFLHPLIDWQYQYRYHVGNIFCLGQMWPFRVLVTQ